MSCIYNEEWLEARYEQYLEQGYSPKDASIMAQEDFDNGDFAEPLDYEEEV
tara:strand:+ start:1189 stop:1341 length:153 start_codon:yes stop_codon:yes gene_type:complete